MSSLQGCLIRSKTDLSLAWLDTRVELGAQGNTANRIPPSIQRWGGEVVFSAACFARRAMELWRLPCAFYRRTEAAVLRHLKIESAKFVLVFAGVTNRRVRPLASRHRPAIPQTARVPHRGWT